MYIFGVSALYLALTVCPESALQQLIHLAYTDMICQRCTLNKIYEKTYLRWSEGMLNATLFENAEKNVFLIFNGTDQVIKETIIIRLFF